MDDPDCTIARLEHQIDSLEAQRQEELKLLERYRRLHGDPSWASESALRSIELQLGRLHTRLDALGHEQNPQPAPTGE